MAVSIVQLTASGHSGPGATTTHPTGTFTAPLYRLILVAVGIDDSGGGGHDFSLTGLGITWVSIRRQEGGASDNEERPVELFYGIGNGQTGEITITDSTNFGTNPIQWSVAYVKEVKISNGGADAIVQSNGNGEGNPNTSSNSVGLSAFADAANATFGVVMINGSGSVTEGSGFTEVSDNADSGKRMQTQFKASNDTGVDWSFGSTQASSAIAIELAFGADLNATGFLMNLI